MKTSRFGKFALRPQFARRWAQIVSERLDQNWPTGANSLQFALGHAHFNQGDYEQSNRHFVRITSGKLVPEATRMADWTRHKLGEISIGWPRYPVTQYTPPKVPDIREGSGSIFVDNPNRPVELATQLRLPHWLAPTADPRPVLVWFNFRDSIGGELFTARAVKALVEQLGLKVVIATDNRLRDVIAQNIPAQAVVSKTSDLLEFEGMFSGYLLARDALAMTLALPGGLDAISSIAFSPPAASQKQNDPIATARPVFAFSWKTTNKRQGRYRNIPLADFAQELSRIDAEFLSAQHGVSDSEARLLKRTLGNRFRPDCLDTSASIAVLSQQLAACDGIISIDNSVLHIAGAFGIPALGLLSVPSYWAWPATGSNSRWYPTVKLRHQQKPGDWSSVLENLHSAVVANDASLHMRNDE